MSLADKKLLPYEISLDVSVGGSYVTIPFWVTMEAQQSAIPKSIVEQCFSRAKIRKFDKNGRRHNFDHCGIEARGAISVYARYKILYATQNPTEVLVIDSDRPACLGMNLIQAFSGEVEFGTKGITIVCATCRRAYCSRECQLVDWRQGCHKRWCGKSGEFSVDFEFREVMRLPRIFALRDFKRGDVVFVEPAKFPIKNCQKDGEVMLYGGKILEELTKWKKDRADRNEEAQDYITPMLFPKWGKPERNSILIIYNMLLWGGDSACLLPITSYINTRCRSNGTAILAPHLKQGVMVVKCICDVPAGGEITVNESEFENSYLFDKLDNVWFHRRTGFDQEQQKCVACDVPEDQDVMRLKVLSLSFWLRTQRQEEKWEGVLETGAELIKILEEQTGASPIDCCRVYFMMFRAKLQLEEFPSECVKFAEKAIEHAKFYCEEDSTTICSLNSVINDPLTYFDPEVNSGLKEITRAIDNRFTLAIPRPRPDGPIIKSTWPD